MLRNENPPSKAQLEILERGKKTAGSLHSAESPNKNFFQRLFAQTGTVSVGLYGHVNLCPTLSPLLISIRSVTSTQLPLTESSVTVIHYFTILFQSTLESQWDSHWQLIAGPTDEYWLKTSPSVQRRRRPTWAPSPARGARAHVHENQACWAKL